MIHMENKDLHVAIVFSPICGPNGDIVFEDGGWDEIAPILT